MHDIKTIYQNHLGTAFYWKKGDQLLSDRVQVIFKDMGFYYTTQELQLFANCIQDSFENNKTCASCEFQQQCHRFLLKTPNSQIDLAVTMTELSAVKDLVMGTLFTIDLEKYLYGEGMN
ncbi:hypothetical protein [Flavobacterium turcicum]|uniref:Uncharacterized protein n=1 Tax=Flavobacterium turcicum TaxID=2764718 RepID=A0ABR7JDH3_9FLAO|nr:hypothetical protein [Flavobacterium turcicum]MBC5862209.1 hypothetical protein [Flavobacterium turcicum]NHL00940.1 hypothetical protein [Flavobacterium turcicum]